MSYILDALKKLETEKELKARGTGMVNIAGELFKNGPAPPKAHRNWPLILGLVLLASLLTFGATYLLLHEGKGKKLRPSARLVPPVAVSVPLPSTLPAPAPKQPVPVPSPPAAAAPRHAAPLPAPAPKAVKAPSVSRQPPVALPVKPAVAPAAMESAPAEPARSAAASLIPAPTDIKVSGIAWQDRRSASRVVANGFLLREGDTVAGARIVEIFQNRVRFSSAAGTFELYLVATGLPAAPK